MDICDDDAIDTIYTDVVKNNVAKLVAQYPQYEHRYLWNLYDKGRRSNDNDDHFCDADDTRDTTNNWNVVDSRAGQEEDAGTDTSEQAPIFNDKNVVSNYGCDTREDNEMHDNICANFDENSKAETTGNTRVENEAAILSEVNDVITDDCIAI